MPSTPELCFHTPESYAFTHPVDLEFYLQDAQMLASRSVQKTGVQPIYSLLLDYLDFQK